MTAAKHDPRIAILVPSNRDVKSAFARSLIDVISVTPAEVFIRPSSSLLSQARQELLDGAIRHGYTHALFLDDDMAFTCNVAKKLLSHGLPAVGVNYLRKSRHPEWTAVKDGIVVSSDVPSTGAQEVESCGLGIFMVRLRDIAHIPAPWFEVRWDERLGSYAGEDRFFCKKLREYGVPVHIDHDLSRMVDHIGNFEYDYAYRNSLAVMP